MKRSPFPTAIFRSKGWPLRKTISRWRPCTMQGGYNQIRYSSRTQRKAEAEERGEQRSSPPPRAKRSGRRRRPIRPITRNRSSIPLRYQASPPPKRLRCQFDLSGSQEIAKAKERGQQRVSAIPQPTPRIRALFQVRQRAEAAGRSLRKPRIYPYSSQPWIMETGSESSPAFDYHEPPQSGLNRYLLSKPRRMAKAEERREAEQRVNKVPQHP